MLEKLVKQLNKTPKLDITRLHKIKRRFSAENVKMHCNASLPTNAQILAEYKNLVKHKKIKPNPALEYLLRKRKIRTLSGVAPIAVLTKPYECPGKCAFCPDEKSMPKSYLSNEPAVMRAILAKFDPHRQVEIRLRALAHNGHPTDKIELIIMGGTFTHLPKKYKTWFVKRCFDACNKTTSKNLKQAQKKNEKTKHRIIGMTLETRPDHIDEKTLKYFRELGCTKVEMGAQIIDDKILQKNNRGHGVAEIINATKLLKQFGFKIAYHIMPNLPGATAQKDLQLFKKLFSDQNFQPDMLKIYPTVVTKGSKLYRWWKQGKHKPYSQKTLDKLLINMKLAVPNYVRIIRLIRDIPKESIEAGNLISNLRYNLQQELHKQSKSCKCIRCCEARGDTTGIKKAKLFIKKYRASGGTEYFLHFSTPNEKTLFAFCRLRLPDVIPSVAEGSSSLHVGRDDIKNARDDIKNARDDIKNARDDKSAIIRELHTYGQMIPLAQSGGVQHMGFGKKLMREAEKIAKQNGHKKMSVISGIGVREYYRKLGYRLRGTYMVKNLKTR